LPEKLKSIRKLTITYDGRKESMFALKQFSYLFPQLTALPTEIVYLSEEERDDVPKTKLLKEYVSNHFSSVNITKVFINPKNDLARWAAMHEDVLVIAGSYSRNRLDSIPDSFIDPILEMKQLPGLITHP
jgi:hypothetical protein